MSTPGCFCKTGVGSASSRASAAAFAFAPTKTIFPVNSDGLTAGFCPFFIASRESIISIAEYFLCV